MKRNIFRSLFAYRPREGRSAQENYLTEAFAHALQESPEDCQAWLAQVLGLPVGSIGKQIHVETQVPLASADGAARAIVDMVIHAEAGGKQVTMLCEHKWDSPTSREQIARYQAVAAAQPNPHVLFIAPTAMQVAEAKNAGVTHAMQWHEVCTALGSSESAIVRDFTDFLAGEGLGPPEALSWPALAAYVASGHVKAACSRLAGAIEPKVKGWGFLPGCLATSSIQIQEFRWGRIGVERGEWSPCLFLGFLLDGADHELDLVDAKGSIDLMLALDSGDPKKTIDPTVLAERAAALREMAPSVLYSHELASKWRKILGAAPPPSPGVPTRLACWLADLINPAEGGGLFHRLRPKPQAGAHP